MKKLHDWNLFHSFLSRRKIRNQLNTIYFFAFVIPIMVLGIVLTFQNYSMLTDYHNDMLDADNIRVKNLLFEFTAQVKTYADNIISNESIRHALDTKYRSSEEFRKIVDRIDLLDSYRKSFLEICDVTI